MIELHTAVASVTTCMYLKFYFMYLAYLNLSLMEFTFCIISETVVTIWFRCLYEEDSASVIRSTVI